MLIFFNGLFVFNTYATEESIKSPQTLFGGQMFNTNKHEKAKGARLRLEYPKDWIAREGRLPNVVQVFSPKNDNLNSVQIIIKDFLKKLPKDEQALTDDIRKELFSDENLKLMAPKNSQIISISRTNINGEESGMIEYSTCTSIAGIDVCMSTTAFVFITPKSGTMTSIQCSTGDKVKVITQVLMNSHKKMKELCQKIGSSVIIDEKWN